MAAILYKWFLLSALFVWGKAPAPAPATTFHPFYISVTEVNQNLKNQTLEISSKMFAEDLEEILEKNYKTSLDLNAAKDHELLNRLIPDYVNKHFKLAVDGKMVKLDFVGFEVEKESVYCYFQVNNVADVKTVNIYNALLYDFNEGQINIMHVVVNGRRQSTKLDFPKKQAGFSF